MTSRWILQSPGQPPTIALSDLIVGRLPECDVVIADGMVSGRHLELRPDGDDLIVTDLGSSNGTLLDGKRLVGSQRLSGSAEITIGTTRLQLTRTAPPSAAGRRVPVDALSSAGPFVVVQSGGNPGAHIGLAEDRPIIVGRADECDFVVSDSLVSNEHLRVRLTQSDSGTLIEIEDLGSANGTLVNGSPIAPHERVTVSLGDAIQAGETVLVVSQTPSAPRRAATVVRSIPAGIDTAGAERSVPLPPTTSSKPRRSAVLIGVIGIAGIAVVGVIWSMFGGGGTRDAAWIRENRGPMTVEVGANSPDYEGTSYGSGSIIDGDTGLVITNMHVLADNRGNLLPDISAGIRLDGTESWIDVDIVGFSACDDLAVLQLRDPGQRAGLEEVPFGAPEDLAQGNTVVALGFPGTLESAEGGNEQMTLTQGVISKLDVRNVDTYPDLIQIDADLNPGNSGGPLFNMEGEQIGVNTLRDGEGTQGINYAINIRRVNELLPDLKSGSRQSGWNACPN